MPVRQLHCPIPAAVVRLLGPARDIKTRNLDPLQPAALMNFTERQYQVQAILGDFSSGLVLYDC